MQRRSLLRVFPFLAAFVALPKDVHAAPQVPPQQEILELIPAEIGYSEIIPVPKGALLNWPLNMQVPEGWEYACEYMPPYRNQHAHTTIDMEPLGPYAVTPHTHVHSATSDHTHSQGPSISYIRYVGLKDDAGK